MDHDDAHRKPAPPAEEGPGLLPPAGCTPAEYEPEIFPPRKSLDQGTPPEAPDQYTLRELFALVTAVAVLFSVLGCIPGGYSLETIAGVAGLAVLAGLAVQSLGKFRRRILRLAWWSLLAFYVVACLGAVVKRLMQD